MGPAIDAFFKAILVIFVLFVPLGAWKMIEIIIWLFTKISVEVKP